MTRFDNSRVGNRGMRHLNGNVLCAIDTETTGLMAGYHDLIEIAILPLDSNLEPMKDVMPFDIMIKPKRPENIEADAIKVNGIDLAHVEIHGFEAWDAADMLESWFENQLKLAPGKKIAPLGKNWPFDSGFIKDWLKQKTYDNIFDYHYRDVGPVALFFNDRADFNAADPPFPKNNLQYLANKLGVKTDRAHRAMDDALATAQVYKKLMTEFIR